MPPRWTKESPSHPPMTSKSPQATYWPPRARPQVADQFAARLVWMSNDRLQPGRSYLVNIINNTIVANVTELKRRLDVDTMARLAARTLGASEFGICYLSVARRSPSTLIPTTKRPAPSSSSTVIPVLRSRWA